MHPDCNTAACLAVDRPFALVVDLEATCCDGGTIPRGENEMIEIGAVVLDSVTLEIVDEFGAFVRPVRHPQLTPFCTRLTGITQDMVDNAPGFPDVMACFSDWLADHWDFLFCSWGDYDLRQFELDCGFHGVGWPFPPGHLNLKKAVARAIGRKPMGMARALDCLGLEIEGRHHRGIDDARNIARIVRVVCATSPAGKTTRPDQP